jgi:N-acetylglucosaminyl-diphospho-decaprenol L-rhamnosyltransferase
MEGNAAPRSQLATAALAAAADDPAVSVIILNYNGAMWLERCVDSLRRQTIMDRIEVILADNLSTDGSDLLGEKLMRNWPQGRFLQHGVNLGFAEGNNRAARQARGEYLFFLNNDAWLEPDCLEVLLRETSRAQADAATPLVMDFDDDSFQSLGATGFDMFGFPTARLRFAETREVLMPEGCSYLVRRELFERLGGFDAEFFMFAEELDLSWRVWITGGRAAGAPAARLHHRGAANVNPQGGGTLTEFRTSDTKRFYTNRNTLVLMLKNAQHILLLLVPLQAAWLALEAVVGLLLVRRWSFVREVYLAAFADCWRLRGHILNERRRIRQCRRRSDWQMLRFFRWQLNRWDEIRRLWRFGIPKVTPK